jgi:plasminogen activator inhibitor 1 RNA-binding protein
VHSFLPPRRATHTPPASDTQKKVHQGWGGDRGDTEYNAETQGAADASKEPKDSGDAWGAGGAGGGTTAGWDSGAPATTEGEADPWAAPAPAENAQVGWGDGDGDAKSPDGEGKPKKRYDEDEDDNKMTLDEYLKKKAASEVVPKLELRKVDGDAFKDAVALKKDAEANNYFVGKVCRPSS